MSIATPFARLFGRSVPEVKAAPAPASAPAPTMFGLDWLVAPNTTSGPVVTPQTAMTVPTVASAVTLIASTIGTLPAKAFERTPDGAKRPAGDHPAHALVHGRANAYQSAGALRGQLALDAILHGNAYAFANRVNGTVRELTRLDPRSIEVLVDDAGTPAYRSTVDKRTFAAADIMHVRARTSFDDLVGVSPIHLHREAIGLALTLEAHAARLFGRGARPSGVLRFKGKLTTEAVGRMKASWQAAHGGDQSGGTAMLEEDAEFQPIQFTSVDSQFMEQRQAAAYEVARAFNVPPSMVGLVDRATWGNAEQQNRQFVALTLRPWLQAFRAEYERVLLDEGDDAHFVDFVVDDLIRPDTATRASAYATMRSAGVVTANEVRAWENLPARPDGDALTNPYTSSDDAPAAATDDEGTA